MKTEAATIRRCCATRQKVLRAMRRVRFLAFAKANIILLNLNPNNRMSDLTKRTSILFAAVLVFLIGGAAQPLKTTPAKEFMREKLEHSQKVLEGIAVEDYRLILVHSQKRSAMSQNAERKMFQNPEYLELSASFRRYADTLTQALRVISLVTPSRSPTPN